MPKVLRLEDLLTDNHRLSDHYLIVVVVVMMAMNLLDNHRLSDVLHVSRDDDLFGVMVMMMIVLVTAVPIAENQHKRVNHTRNKEAQRQQTVQQQRSAAAAIEEHGQRGCKEGEKQQEASAHR